jgi:hypothetical protein
VAAAAVLGKAEGSDGAKTAEIWIYGDIGESWWDDTITARQLCKELAELDVDTMTVRINSYGDIDVKLRDGAVPDVTVTVARTSGLQFSVIGQVRTPGIFTPGRYVTVLEALSFSGGVNEFASLSTIVVVRKSGETLTVIPVNLANVLRSKSVSAKDVSALPMVQSGDTIIVP